MADNLKIIRLHNILYEYLNALHQEDASFLFRMRRRDKDKRLQKGYCFSGNSHYLETSFWDFQTPKSQSPILRLVYHFDTEKWFLELIAQENELRFGYFNKMSNIIGGFDLKSKDSWSKELSDEGDFVKTIHTFVAQEKPRIDIYLKNNPAPNVVDFIRVEDFKNDKEKIDKNRILVHFTDFYTQISDLISDYTAWKKGVQTALPFALSEIHIENFQGIQKGMIQNLPLDAQWIFLTGENGFGKTSFLRAIAKVLVPDEEEVYKLKKEQILFAKGYKKGNPTLFQATMNRSESDFKIATYGVSRFLFNDVNQEDSDKSKLKTYSLFHDNGQLINIERVLLVADQAKEKQKERGIQPTTFDQLRSLFLKIIPQLADIKVEYIENEPITNSYQVRYYEKGENNAIYDPVKINDLAAGYRSILTMIGDMVVRLSENLKNSVDDLEGIVLIDEIDAHLHPKYQYELPNLLSSAFPKVQFIVSTHSPIPLLGAKSNRSVVLRVHRSKALGITAERLDDTIPIHRLNPNALLTSPIFDFQHLFSEDTAVADILPVDDYQEVERMNVIQKRLQRLRETGLIQ
jgi:predicted ATPase